MENTLAYNDKEKGFVSFYLFEPDWMVRLNNRLFSIKNGQLWLHNDKDNPIRNNFYGVQYNSKLVIVVNDASSEDKIFKNLVLESNLAWDAEIKTNLSRSTIKKEEFRQRESRWFSHTRKNEDETDLHGLGTQGIGVIVSVTGTGIRFNSLPLLLDVGDKLYQVNGSANELIGTITAINTSTNVVTVDPLTNPPTVGLFCYSKKVGRIEGAEIRGYYAEITLENDDTVPVEIYAIESTIV